MKWSLPRTAALLLSLSLFAHFVATDCFAEKSKPAATAAAKGEEPEALPAEEPVGLPKPPPVPPAEHLRARFFLTMQLIFQERYAEAGDEIHGLLDEGRDYGYRAFPDFSMLLLQEAEKVHYRNPELAGFFVRQAIQLSPNDLSVALSTLTFSDVVERKMVWKYIRESISPSLARPMFLFPFLVNCSVLALAALTIATLVGGFVQLLRHGELVFRYITRFIPRNYRGILGPAAVLFALGLPLFWGPGAALACWAVILSRSIKHCRWFALLVGVLFLGWYQLLNVGAPFKARTQSDLSRIVDQVNANALVIDAKKILTEELEKNSKDPLLAFSLARVHVYEGNFEEGENLFRVADALADGSGEISRVARLNLAVLAIRAQKWDEARQILEKDEALGGTRFEVLYNLALVHLAQLDIEKYRSYYTQAQDFDRTEWQRLDNEQGQQHLPVWSNMKSSPFLHAFLSMRVDADPAGKAAVSTSAKQLSSALVRGSQPSTLSLLGLGLIGLPFLRRSRSGKQWMEQHGSLDTTAGMPADSSLLWSLLPGGVFLAGKRPVVGVLFAGICFSVAFVATGWPLTFLPLSAFPVNMQKQAFTLFLIAYGLGFIVPVLIETLRRPAPAAGGAR